MQKNFITTAVVLVVLVLVFIGLNFFVNNKESSPVITGSDHKNTSYVIDGEPTTLVNGVSEMQTAPGSTSKVITRHFGNEARGDFDNNGREDVAFLLTRDNGGSGTFYYLVAALNTPDGFVGSQAYFIGDRISPQTTSVQEDGVVIVNFADRAAGESFAVNPSVAKSLYLQLESTTMQFNQVTDKTINKEVVSKTRNENIALSEKSWEWLSSTYNDSRELKPKKTGIFILTFMRDGSFGATTDCNSMGGRYAANDGRMTFTNINQTEMYCENSEEMEFAKILNNAQGYRFTEDDRLVLDLKLDSSSAIFK